MTRAASLLAALAALVLLAPVSGAQATSRTSPKPPTNVTHHYLTVDGLSLTYTAAAGFMPVHHPNGANLGDMSYVAYTVAPKPGEGPRPLAFLWNGGPGANSTPLHYGAFGPLRLANDRLKPNAATLLDIADLVFIDALETGFGRVDPQLRATTNVFTAETDTAAFAEFIAGYMKDDPSRPFFLLGESYGVRRAVTVTNALRANGLRPQGLVLISGYPLVAPEIDHGLDGALRIPAYAAYAFDTGKLDGDVGTTARDVRIKAERWARSAYTAFTASGDPLAGWSDFARNLSRFLGADPELLSTGRLSPQGVSLTGEAAVFDRFAALRVRAMFDHPIELDAYDYRYPRGVFDAVWISHAVIDDLRVSLAFDTTRRYIGQDAPEPRQFPSFVNAAGERNFSTAEELARKIAKSQAYTKKKPAKGPTPKTSAAEPATPSPGGLLLDLGDGKGLQPFSVTRAYTGPAMYAPASTWSAGPAPPPRSTGRRIVIDFDGTIYVDGSRLGPDGEPLARPDPTLARNIVNYDATWSGFRNTGNLLPNLMDGDKALRVFIAGGYYDDLFPCLSTEETAKPLLAGFGARASVRCYEGGHMMYLDEGVAQSLAGDIRAFIRGGAQLVE